MTSLLSHVYAAGLRMWAGSYFSNKYNLQINQTLNGERTTQAARPLPLAAVRRLRKTRPLPPGFPSAMSFGIPTLPKAEGEIK